MSVRRFGLVWLVSLCGLLGSCAFGGASAGAAITHQLLSRITEVPAGPGVSSAGPLVQPRALTVDSGALYVADGGAENGRLDKFDASSGALKLQFAQVPSLSYLRQGVAVAHGTGEVYLGGDDLTEGPKGAVAVFDAAGSLQKVWNGADTPSGEFGCFECNGPGDIAVDNNPSSLTDWAAGDVYVSVPAQGVVDVFKPKAGGEEEYVTQLSEREPGVPFENVFGVAVDPSTGDVLVIDADGVDVFEPTVLDQYVLVRRLSETQPGVPLVRISAVAVDGGNGDVYVSAGEQRAIAQFSSAGVYLGSLKGTPSGPFEGSASLAVDPAAPHGLYVGDRQGEADAVDVFGPTLTIPDVASEPASALKAHSATLNGTVNPDAIQLSDCRFEYGTSSAYGQSAPCVPAAGAIPADSSQHPVSAQVTGLAPDMTYHFRLQASNENGTNTESADREFTTRGPGIQHTSVLDVTSNSATLAASIDPNNAATTYYFQYGTSTAYGSEAPAAPGATVGSGKGDVEVNQPLSLTPGTVYHFRVVVLSEPVPGEPFEEAGPDRTFTTRSGQASELPDGRAWEMVSPPDKRGGALEAIGAPVGGLIQAAWDGHAISYLAGAPIDAEPVGNRSFVFTQVLSIRGPDGWSSQGIATPNEAPAGLGRPVTGEYALFSEDLSAGLVQSGGDTPLSPAASEETPYRRGSNGEFTPLVTAANVLPGAHFGGGGGSESARGVQFEGAAPDLEHIVVSSPQALTLGSGAGQDPGEVFHNLYEWADGSLQVASVLPNERPVTAEGSSTSELGIGGKNVRRAVSDDGSRIVWSSGGEVGPHIYVRDMRLRQTVQLDVVEVGAQGGNELPRFQTASSDGSKVFFVDQARLTADATGESDLYMCEVGIVAGHLTCKLKDLTVGENVGEAADVRGEAIGVGEDGRYIYFVASGALAPGAVPGSCHAKRTEVGYVPGAACNLYVYDTVTGVRKLVAVLSNEDAGDWQEEVEGDGAITELTARVSANGRYLAFMSQRSLTGYDNIDARSGVADEEVFLYDQDTGRLVCASCNPTGARPSGLFDSGAAPGLLVDRPGSWRGEWLAASLPGWARGSNGGQNYYQSRYLSDSGRLFFDAADALVPGDINGTEDVYEYEPGGVGGCSGGSGCVGLISSGTSGEESAFIDASVSGDDVFFLTSSRLVGQDIDGSRDVYDARVCSASSPCVQGGTAQAPVCSSGEACRMPAPPQPGVFAAPSSMSVSGVGNLASPSGGAVKRRSLTRAQKLAGALRACRKQPRRKRVVCEARARRLYGSGVKAKHRGAGATRKGKG